MADEGEITLRVMGEFLTRKIPGRRTGGAYSLFEVASPQGAGLSPHVNHREYEFLIDEHPLRAEAGFLLYVAKGTLHAHKNVSRCTGRMLVSQTPGGLYERFFEEAGKPADVDGDPLVEDEQTQAASIVAIAAEYGIEMPPPIT